MLAITVVSVYLVSIISSADAGGCSASTPQNFTYSALWKGYYKLYGEPKNWVLARYACSEDGADLAVPYTLKQAAVLLNLMKGHELTCGIYIGVRRTQPAGYFNTLDGLPLCRLPHQWAPRQPDATAAQESCAVLLPNGTLADEPCSETMPFVCYKKQQPCYTCLNLCRTKDKAYQYEQRTGSCYKFHIGAKSWGDAVDICSNEGGHLAIINSDVESRVLKELFAQHPQETIQGATHTSILHVGFHQLFKRNCWRNIDGYTLRGSGFRAWAPRQPDGGGGQGGTREDCGSVLRNGLLNDVSCDAKCPFVCEINVSPAD